ncbi:hypothetical protein ACV07N_08305 [Roseivirga echinicomitans]
MQVIRHSMAFLILLVLATACKSDDDLPSIKFTKEQLIMVYGDSEKSWRVKGHYENFSYNRLSDFNDCYKDDVYTFKAESKEVAVILGDLGCYWSQPDQQLATVSYFYDEDSGRFFMEHSRGEAKGEHFASQFFMLELSEIAENRLLFSARENGRYTKAILFERIE